MSRSYYVLGELTIGLEPVARYAARLARLIEKHLTPRRKVSKREDFLVQDVGRWLVTGDDKALDTLIANVRQYARCFRDVGRERQFNASAVARIHVMAACDLLVDTLPREKATKALLRKTACDLWARACRLHLGIVPTEMLRDLRAVRWRRIYSDLGLSDLREAHRKLSV